MTLASSANSTPFADVLDKVEARLRAVFTQTGFVRTCAAPNDRLSQYVAQEGLLVRVRTGQPLAKTGAGRYGLQSSRIVDVIVLTQSLADAAGEDSRAVRAHVAREESVVNILQNTPPVGTAYNLRVGILIEWVEGGEDIERQIKVDPGMLVSVLPFRVQYTAPCVVNL